MKKTLPSKTLIGPGLTRLIGIFTAVFFCDTFVASAQQTYNYRAPQDTVKIRRSANSSLTTYKTSQEKYNPDSRILGAAIKAASRLTDTSSYDRKSGLLLRDLFSEDDLVYFSKQNINTLVALFELINKNLPNGKIIVFRTDQEANATVAENPLVLKNLRAAIAANPATLSQNLSQWKENVYQAYKARDYGTKLENTITITAATRELRESPSLTIVDFDGKSIAIGSLLKRALFKGKDQNKAEASAVLDFRMHTFPNKKISEATANQNYRKALFELIRLQENDLNRHPESKNLLNELSADLSKGEQSKVVRSLKNSTFFDANVPGNLGPVLLIESKIINAENIQNNARDKAMELLMLTALHYGERDAIKLFSELLMDRGNEIAASTNKFTDKRLAQLTYHGTEKLKSLGYGKDKTNEMTFSDLVLVAVATPEAPETSVPEAFLSMNQISNQQVGQSIISYYNTTVDQQTNNSILFSPQISLGSKHTEYRASFDAVDFVPEIVNGSSIGQKGSRVTQNGIELRLGSDIYFSNIAKLSKSKLKPFIYPEFGAILGVGTRSVGYDNQTTPGPLGAVPQFKNTYVTWGSHVGLNVSAISIGVDATFMTTPKNNLDPNVRFFDLSQGMTYYRYSLTTHVIDFGLGKINQNNQGHLILDIELSGETNNTGLGNKTITNSGSGQIGNSEWSRDYARAHPGGVYDLAVAKQMIADGDVKANYAASDYGAIHVGYRKSNFLLKATGGLYNLYAVSGKNLINGELFKNTIHGNFFAGISLTYNFRSGSKSESRKRTESYQVVNNVESAHKVDETTDQQVTKNDLRNRAIFTNKSSRNN